MGIVAKADGEVRFRTAEEIRRQSQSPGTFEPEALDAMKIIEEESLPGSRPRQLVHSNTRPAQGSKITLSCLIYCLQSRRLMEH
jgi:hypothetical protein